MRSLTGHSLVVSALDVSEGTVLYIDLLYALPSFSYSLLLYNRSFKSCVRVRVLWLADGSLLVSGSRDSSMRLWDTITGTLLRTARTPNNPITHVRFARPGDNLFVQTGEDCETRCARPEFSLHNCPAPLLTRPNRSEALRGPFQIQFRVEWAAAAAAAASQIPVRVLCEWAGPHTLRSQAVERRESDRRKHAPENVLVNEVFPVYRQSLWSNG